MLPLRAAVRLVLLLLLRLTLLLLLVLVLGHLLMVRLRIVSLSPSTPSSLHLFSSLRGGRGRRRV